MLRKSFAAAAAVVLFAGLLPGSVQAQVEGFQKGDWELTLTGTGSNNKSFNQGTFGAGATLGYFISNDLELSLAQSVSYADDNTSTSWRGATRGAVDYHFNLGRWRPFVGANIGYVYGDGVADTFEAGPEVGVKYFVNNTTFIYGKAEYEFFFRNSGDSGRGFNRGQFVYSLGIGFKWK